VVVLLSMKKILIIAGEVSGDMHGAELTRALLARDPSLRIIAVGGQQMSRAGANVLFDIIRYSPVGMTDTLANLNTFTGLYRKLISLLRTEKPDLVVPIDMPDFNLRFAERVKEHGIPVVYYISPQIWAWRQGRVKQIARIVTRMLVLFKFEEEFYARHGVSAKFVGHPFVETTRPSADSASLTKEFGLRADTPRIGLLPGSRTGEVKRLLPIMLDAADILRRDVPAAQFILPRAPGIPAAFHDKHRVQMKELGVRVIDGRSHDVMACCDILIVASGSATLEAAIIGTPMVVVYKVPWSTWWGLGWLLRVSVFALVNIIGGKIIAPEMIQGRAKPGLIAREALGPPGAADRAAQEVLDVLHSFSAAGKRRSAPNCPSTGMKSA
jgi:lipid-A-disaccharide synthase